jgi:predicted metal-dependent HD superfamily phosphohydrolase
MSEPITVPLDAVRANEGSAGAITSHLVNDVDNPVEGDASYKNNTIPQSLLQEVEVFASNNIRSLEYAYRYHCLEHTKMVVENARQIAYGMNANDHDTCILLIAAWLHDVGFTVTYAGHEKESCRMMRELIGDRLPEEELTTIEGAIMGTKIPQSAGNSVAAMLCDADLLYLGGDQFFPWSARLREEHQLVLNREYSDTDWLNLNIQFVEGHKYFTDYARTNAEEGRLRNIAALKAIIQ